MADYGMEEEEEESIYDNIMYQDQDEQSPSSGNDISGTADDEKQITVLLIGQSGSGKSSISKDIINSIAPKRKVYVLVKHGKKEEENQPQGWRRIGFENLAQISNCALVVEDVLSSSKIEFEDLKEVLHYSNHHRHVNPVIMICHSLHNTGSIYALLPGFSFIYLAARQTSVNSMRSLLRYFGYDKHEKETYMRQLRNCREKYAHFVLEVESREIRLTKIGDSSPLAKSKKQEEQESRSKLSIARNNATKYMALLSDKDRCLAIFDLIITHIPQQQLNAENLTVCLKKRGAKKNSSISRKIHVNLIDYISALTKDDFHAGLEDTDPLLLKFHRYLFHDKEVRVPNCFITNPVFHQNDAASS